MLRKADNKFFAAIAEGTQTKTALDTAVAVGAKVSNSNLPVGAVVVTNLGLIRLDSTALGLLGPTDQFIIVQGKGASMPLLKSEVLTKGNISITKRKHEPAVQQITAIGYNGIDGALPSANDTSYFIKVRKNDNDAANRSQPSSLFGQFKTGSTATQESLALGLAGNLVKNFSIEPANNYIHVGVLMDQAGGAPAGTTTSFTLTSGSNEVLLTNPGTLTNVAVGDWIRFDAFGGEVFQVLAYTVNESIVLDRPVNETKVVLIGATRRILASASVGANFGITLTGKVADFDVAAFRDYYANRFTASFSDESTIITPLQGARNGTGVWQKVAMDEYMTYGYEGMNGMIGVPPAARDQDVIIGAKYSAIEIAWTESIGTLVTSHGATGSVLVYCGLDTASELPATTAAGDVANVLGSIALPTFISTSLNE